MVRTTRLECGVIASMSSFNVDKTGTLFNFRSFAWLQIVKEFSGFNLLYEAITLVDSTKGSVDILNIMSVDFNSSVFALTLFKSLVGLCMEWKAF